MNIQQPDTSREPAAPDGYVLAASVVDTFQPERLAPVQGFEGDLGNLLDVSVMSEKEGGVIEWRLPNDVRRSALRVLAQHERLVPTLEANRQAADNDSPYQRMFEQYLAGEAIPLEAQDLEQLQASLNAVRLLDGVVPNLPDANRIRVALIRRDFMRQFELLAGSNFVGREGPLRQLREFVDVLPQSLFATVRRSSVDLLGSLGAHRFLHEAPLMITGMGGMGKSALLSKFLLEHLQPAPTSPDLLFAYVDFDKPAIWPDQPLTVLAEIAQQLALQVPNHAASFAELNVEIAAELSFMTRYGSDYDSSEAFFSLGTHETSLSTGTMTKFGRLCDSALEHTTRKTLLLVLDTFEEVSQRSVRHQVRLLDFVGGLQRILPRLRVVISGRGMHPDNDEDRAPTAPTGPVDELAKAVTPLELQELSDDEASDLLVSLGSPNPRTNKAIVNRVGGHPLSLKLAAQLVQTVAKKLDRAPGDLTGADLFGKEWVARMSEGLLYRRIISHIPDEPLQKLADPGLVLREVTADLIFNVLNEPCGLRLRTRAEAEDLFERLKQFNQLVSIQSTGVVRHRSELRQRVLKEMMYGQRPLCRDIWSRAAHYYQERGDNRAEELYCRLMLDEPTTRLTERWQVGLEKTLLKSRSEMPVRARQFVDLMALMADGQPQFGASDEDLDMSLLAEDMKLLLARGNADAALDLFRATIPGKTPRFDSALFTVHVRAIAQSGDLDRAIEMAWKAFGRLEEAGKAGTQRYEELLLLCCQVARAQHAASAGALRAVWRGVLRRSKPLSARELCEAFFKVQPDTGRHVLLLRIAIALLELFDLEAADNRDIESIERDRIDFCAERARGALRHLRPDFFGVDGGLLVRSLAWLSASHGQEPETQELLDVPQVVAVLRRDYGGSLNEYLAKERGRSAADLQAQLRAGLQGASSASFESFRLTDTQTGELGAALRHVIRARDSAQGGQFS